MLMPMGGASVGSVTWVLTSAEVLLSSLDSAIELSGSTTAVLVMEPTARRRRRVDRDRRIRTLVDGAAVAGHRLAGDGADETGWCRTR
jgi:hypothetical protein